MVSRRKYNGEDGNQPVICLRAGAEVRHRAALPHQELLLRGLGLVRGGGEFMCVCVFVSVFFYVCDCVSEG